MQQPKPNPPRMNELMFNIETKLSLLSQIQKSVIQKSVIQKGNIERQQMRQEQQQDYGLQQMNLPMQMLTKKMQEIINEKSPMSQKRTHNNNNYKTFEKKRLHMNELQTGTRNVDQIKGNPTNIMNLTNTKHNQPNNNNNKQEQQHIRQFNPTQQSLMTQSMLNSQSRSSSRIITKFNQIEINYMQKIRSLTFKVSFMQQKLVEKQQQQKQLLESLQTYKLLYSRKQQQINRQIQHKLQEIKQKLIEKFAEQCRLKYNQYITGLKECSIKLSQQKKKRKYYQEQNKVFRLQKQNYQHMYKSLAKKQKQWLQLDIDQTKYQLMQTTSNHDLSAKYYPQQCYQQGKQLINDKRRQNGQNQVEEYSQIQKLTSQDDSNLLDKENVIYNTRNNYINQRQSQPQTKQRVKTKFSIEKTNKSISRSKDKQKSLSKSRDHSTSLNKKSPLSQKKKPSKSRTQIQNQPLKKSAVKKNTKPIHKVSNSTAGQMTKDELIPFLAKGIQQLKERLKMK